MNAVSPYRYASAVLIGAVLGASVLWGTLRASVRNDCADMASHYDAANELTPLEEEKYAELARHDIWWDGF